MLGDWLSGLFSGGGGLSGIGDIGAGSGFMDSFNAAGGIGDSMSGLTGSITGPDSFNFGSIGGGNNFGAMSGLGDIGSLDSLTAASGGLGGLGSKALDFLGSDAFLGGKDQTGMLGQGINLATGLAKYGLGKDQLQMQQDAFDYNKSLSNANLANQANLVNANLSDRERTRLMSRGGDAEDPALQAAVAQYLQEYGAKGSV